MEAFWCLQGRKGGHSINAYREEKEGILAFGACDVYEQHFDNVVISVNRIIKENQQTLSVVKDRVQLFLLLIHTARWTVFNNLLLSLYLFSQQAYSMVRLRIHRRMLWKACFFLLLDGILNGNEMNCAVSFEKKGR